MYSICSTICNTTFETKLKESNVREAYLIASVQIKIYIFDFLNISYRLELKHENSHFSRYKSSF